jgi:hypothetical protein
MLITFRMPEYTKKNPILQEVSRNQILRAKSGALLRQRASGTVQREQIMGNAALPSSAAKAIEKEKVLHKQIKEFLLMNQ